MAENTALEVGKFYMVPCMWIVESLRNGWIPRDGWLPVLGPKHEDAEHLNFPHQHYHVDWRFIPAAQYEYATWPNETPHGKVLTNDQGIYNHIAGRPELKRRKCRRQMPQHPPIGSITNWGTSGLRDQSNWQRLERAHACHRLKPGNICPHRGIDLTSFAQPDGTAICPGHGLRWNLRTGELIPHHEHNGFPEVR